MKKLFWANILLVLLYLLLSCASNNTGVSKQDQLVKASIDLAEAYVLRQNFEKAEIVYLDAIKKYSDYRLLYNLSLVYANQGKYEMAYNISSSGQSLFGQDKIFFKAMAYYANKMGDSQKESSAYEKLLRVNSDDNQSRKELCKALIKCNRKNEAYEHAIYLWYHNVTDRETVEILHELKPEEWDIMLKALPEKK